MTIEICQKNKHGERLYLINTPSPPACYALIIGYTQKPGFMEKYWCMKKNSITNWILYRSDLPLALTPCLKADCDKWKVGESIQIIKQENKLFFIMVNSENKVLLRCYGIGRGVNRSRIGTHNIHFT